MTWFSNLLTRAEWLGVIRHTLTAVGPLLAYVGVEVDDKTWLAVVGGFMTVLGFVWSVKDKRVKDV